MPECLVNDTPTSLDFRPETWGALLEALDAALLPGRQVVTAVRFDGVDEPSFRAPESAARALGGVHRVEVDAAEASALLRDALDAAIESLPALVHGARLAAAAFRSEDPGAHAQLGALVTAMQSLIALTSAAATASRASLGTGAPAEGAVARACLDVDTALRTLLSHQAASDWAAVADALDTNLAPSIARWGDVLAALRTGVAA
jgi:hypothetical protein